MIDAINKNPANVDAFFCFIREYNGCPLPNHFLSLLDTNALPGPSVYAILSNQIQAGTHRLFRQHLHLFQKL